MTAADIAEYSALLFGAYGFGWSSGYLIYAFKRAADMV